VAPFPERVKEINTLSVESALHNFLQGDTATVRIPPYSLLASQCLFAALYLRMLRVHYEHARVLHYISCYKYYITIQISSLLPAPMVLTGYVNRLFEMC
jgi:hypothetical protein